MLTFTRQIFRGAPLNGSSPLPSISAAGSRRDLQGDLPAGDTLFLNYGAVRSMYPYTQQDRYDRNLVDMEVDVAVLENEHLRATFLPGYGGRLWQLWDKDAKRDLVYVNDVLRPSNLALRNAWFSGGIEFNCGIVGHHPFTCDDMFTTSFEVDGCPVLRFYQWERIRNITYQMDFMLPSGSRFLYARTRIHNPNNETVPMYWWSNTAVPEDPLGRVAVPSREAYLNQEGVISRGLAPVSDEGDFSYPVRTPGSKDYFYYMPDDRRRYEGYFLADGGGLIQTSTSGLTGRKLFVWGQQEGSSTWQSFLTENAGPYVEVQAGLGRTQYGCVPMPPMGIIEFAECYGFLGITPEAQSGDYDAFCATIEEALEKSLPQHSLESWLQESSSIAGSFYAARSYGGGEAALEDSLRRKMGQPSLSPWLDFGETTTEQDDFVHLLKYGYMPAVTTDYVPRTFVRGNDWRKLLSTAANGPDRDNWLTWYHLGLVCYSSDGSSSLSDALSAFRHAAGLCSNGSVLYALAVALSDIGEEEAAVACAIKCCRSFGGDLSVAKEILRLLLKLKAYKAIIVAYEDLPQQVQSDGRVEYLYISALVYLNRCEHALDLLLRPNYIIADIREGEMSLASLWQEIKLRLDRDDLVLPKHLNFSAK